MIAPGTVVLIDVMGAVLQKPRTALVVSSDVYHATRPDVIIAFLTTNLAAATGPTDYVLQDWVAAGLHQPSAFRSFISSRPTDEIIKEIGRVSDRDWDEIQKRLRIALGL
jgi:mRNA interferase MazF